MQQFSPESLPPELKKCFKILIRLKARRDAFPFFTPVDPIKLGLPDYNDIVKIPMDLGTILDGLLQARYSSAQTVCNDVQRVWDNCYLYNPSHYPIVAMADRMEDFARAQFRSLLPEVRLSRRVRYVPSQRRPTAYTTAEPSGTEEGTKVGTRSRLKRRQDLNFMVASGCAEGTRLTSLRKKLKQEINLEQSAQESPKTVDVTALNVNALEESAKAVSSLSVQQTPSEEPSTALEQQLATFAQLLGEVKRFAGAGHSHVTADRCCLQNKIAHQLDPEDLSGVLDIIMFADPMLLLHPKRGAASPNSGELTVDFRELSSFAVQLLDSYVTSCLVRKRLRRQLRQTSASAPAGC
eukprot:RCo010672